MKFKAKGVDSPARVALASLLESRAEAAADMREAQARIDRLSALATAAEPVRAALARLDAAESQAFAAWSSDPTLPVPMPASAERINVQRELADAQSKADAASRAIEGLRGETAACAANLAVVERRLNFATCEVALEELAPIADEARTSIARLTALRMKSQVLLRVLAGATADPDAPGYFEFSRAFAAATDSVTNAFALPLPNEPAEFAIIASANGFLAALRTDAGAKMESA